MRAASQRVSPYSASYAAIRRASVAHEARLFAAVNDQFEAGEATEQHIDEVITDADYVAAVVELGLEVIVEAKARDIVAARLRDAQREGVPA